MQKPTVFLSHASDDAASIAGIRSFLQQRTGNTLDVFASSDGQSIRLGANWVHAVEAALGRCKLMFVFVSPSSVKSRWLYFEAGYSYSREIRVVPVGLGGIDIAQIGPPLSLLQGFNMLSTASATNLIAVINDEFNTTFSVDLIDDALAQFAIPRLLTGPLDLGDYTRLVHRIQITLPVSGSTFIPRLQASLIEAKTEFHVDNTSVSTYGMTVISQFMDKVEQPIAIVDLDPIQLQRNCDLLVGSMPSEINETAPMTVYLEKDVIEIDPATKRSSRAFGSALRMSEAGGYTYRGARVSIGHENYFSVRGTTRGPTYVAINPPIQEIGTVELRELIALLFDREIIVFDE